MMLSATSAASVTHFKEPPRIPSNSPLELTAKDGLFIATECHLASLPDEDGDTPLHLAVVQKDSDACQKILELLTISGKSCDIYNNLLQTPLHIAVITNQADVVNLLVNHGASPQKPDRYGSSGYHLCAKYNSTESLIKILQHCDPKKADLNMRDYEGLTALHIAVLNNSVSTFKVLVANGSDIDSKDNKGGRTPLVYAIEMNHKKMVEMLLECDASVSQQTYSGDTALHIASGRGLQDVVRLLLRRGADATMKNTHCETPMSLATSPSVSSMLRSQYKMSSSPERKSALTTADKQYASYVARNTAVPIPPDLLRSINQPLDSKERSDRDVPDHGTGNGKKRGRKLKSEDMVADSSDTIPMKRMAIADPHMFASNSSKDAVPIIVSVSPMPASPSKSLQSNFSQASTSMKLDLKKSMLPPPPPVYVPKLGSRPTSVDDFKLSEQRIQYRNVMDARNVAIVSHLTRLDEVKKEVEEQDEEVVVAEEVEVSAEEIIPVESDDVSSNTNEKTSDSRQSVIVDDSSYDKKSNLNIDATTKFMQNLAKNLTRSSTFPTSILECSALKINSSNVIVQKQPQIDIATALSSTEYDLSPSYRSFTPSASPSSFPMMQYNLSKSKSVPNSPQPSEANLYQLAREGLAVAAMSKNTYSLQSVPRNLPITNYLKSRPSRQAKIRAGTEELQNLALQGLAVAAMNAANSNDKKGSKLNKSRNHNSYDDSDPYKSNMTTIPPHLSKILEPPKEGSQPPPQFHRSFSTPIKSEITSEQAELVNNRPETDNSLTSSNALLVLAHANARKMNVGQAVSAVSMAKAHNTAGNAKQNVMPIGATSLGDVSESTKLNLRQAIMVKNTSTSPRDKIVKSDEMRILEPKVEIGHIPFKMIPHNMSRSCSLPSSPMIKIDKPSSAALNSSIKSSAAPPMTVTAISAASSPTPAAEKSISKTKKMINVAIPRTNISGIKNTKRTVIVPQSNVSPSPTNLVMNDVKSFVNTKSKTEDDMESDDAPMTSVTPSSPSTDNMEVETVSETEGGTNDLLEQENIFENPSSESSKNGLIEKDDAGTEKLSQVPVPLSKKREPSPVYEDKIDSKPESGFGDTDKVLSEQTMERENTEGKDNITAFNLKMEKPDVIVDSFASVSSTQQPAAITESQCLMTTATSFGTSFHITASPSTQAYSQTVQTITVGQPPSTSSFFPHHLAYANFGKEYIPVLMPVGAHHGMPASMAMPRYALPMHKPGELHPSRVEMANGSRDPSPVVMPGRLPFDSVYQIPASSQSLLLNSQQPNANMLQFASQYYMHNPMQYELMQQEYMKNAFLCQQNFLMQNKVLAVQSGQNVVPQTAPATQTTNSISKPVATVTAVPVQRSPQEETSNTEEQPLNLSKRNDKPLNLMKNDRSSSNKGAGSSISYTKVATVDSPKSIESSSATCRSSVIKVVSSVTNDNSNFSQTHSETIAGGSQHLMTIANPTLTTTMSALDNQMSAGIMMPPPLVVPGPIHPSGPAPSLASLPLPPIHYVNGMSFLVRYSHPLQ